jgi:hypothetical protein
MEVQILAKSQIYSLLILEFADCTIDAVMTGRRRNPNEWDSIKDYTSSPVSHTTGSC